MRTRYVAGTSQTRRRHIFYAALLTLLATLLPGCSELERTSRVEIGMVRAAWLC